MRSKSKIFTYTISEGRFAIIKGLEHDNSFTLDISTLGSDTEGDVIHVGGHGEEGLGSISGLVLEASNNSNVLALGESGNFLSIGQSLGWRSSLLLDPVDDGVSSPAPAILHGFAILKELESGITADLELLGCFGLLGGVQLAQLDGGVLLSEDTSGLGVFRGECCITTNCITQLFV